MFLEGEFFKQSCANEFAFNMGIMMAAVWHLTGMVVVGVETQAGQRSLEAANATIASAPGL